MRGTYGAFARRHRLDALPIWVFLLFGTVAWVPWLLTIPYVFAAHPRDRFQGLAGLGGILGGPLSNCWRNRRYWRLNRASRRDVLTVIRTGLPSRQPMLDRIAAERMLHAIQTKQSSPAAVRVVLIISVAVLTAVPIVAAVRSSPWWLCALWPIAAMLLLRLAFRWQRQEDPQTRLDRLRASYSREIGHQ